MVTNFEWYNENDNRKYPLAETSTCLSDEGLPMPEDLLSDLVVAGAPAKIDGAYISMVRVTPLMVSVAVASAYGGLLAGSWPRPAAVHSALALQPLTTDVTGHVVLGFGCSELQDGLYRFSTYAQSGLEHKALRRLDGPLVTSVSKYGTVSPRLVGVVRLDFAPGVDWYVESASAYEGTVCVGLAADRQAEFVGPCDKVGGFNMCGKPPLRTINGVCADENGKITLEVGN